MRTQLDDPLDRATVPLEYDPGVDGQVDFLEADVDYPEGRRRVSFLIVRACYSTRQFVSRVPAENQEALCTGSEPHSEIELPAAAPRGLNAGAAGA